MHFFFWDLWAHTIFGGNLNHTSTKRKSNLSNDLIIYRHTHCAAHIHILSACAARTFLCIKKRRKKCKCVHCGATTNRIPWIKVIAATPRIKTKYKRKKTTVSTRVQHIAHQNTNALMYTKTPHTHIYSTYYIIIVLFIVCSHFMWIFFFFFKKLNSKNIAHIKHWLYTARSARHYY